MQKLQIMTDFSRKETSFMTLNQKQKRFCEEYMIDANATKAALRAGYSERSARIQASVLLTKPNIKSYLKELNEEQKSKNHVSTDEALTLLAEIARGETKETVVLLAQKTGKIVKTKKPPDEQTRIRALAEILKRDPVTQDINLDIQHVSFIDDVPDED